MPSISVTVLFVLGIIIVLVMPGPTNTLLAAAGLRLGVKRAAPLAGGHAWVDGLAADVTLAAAAELAVEPGAELWFAVKATEVAVHPAAL